MSNILRFGIPSLDELFGGVEENDKPWRKGILLPGNIYNGSSSSSVSLCVSGPDGTGKSVLGLHLASRYLADCQSDKKRGQELPRVLYISTDLKFEMARKVWDNFGLDWPNKRAIPFGPTYAEQEKKLDAGLKIELLPCKPLGEDKSDWASQNRKKGKQEKRGTEPLAHYLTQEPLPAIYFVDLASYTAGDDWGFVNRVLSVLEEPKAGALRNLVILDSVQGFEVLTGERDAFGEAQPRRSRIAQVMRSTGNKCHTLFIVEEPEEGKHLPEEFVTDVVIRLRSVLVKDYVRRTLEIEKVRGHSHVRGQHSYLIRSGTGSTTGWQVNSDEPALPSPGAIQRNKSGQEQSAYQSYLHVCHSIHHLNREVMSLKGKGRPADLPERYAAFGIRHLDDMLEPENKQHGYGRKRGDDGWGLRCSTTTALIGNSDTHKSPLGYAFLSRCFWQYAERFRDKVEELGKLRACQKIKPCRKELFL